MSSNDFTYYGSAIDVEDGTEVKCRVEFIQRNMDSNYYEIHMYDSKGRFFSVPRSWKPIEYFQNLKATHQIHLTYNNQQGDLYVYIEPHPIYMVSYGLNEDTTSEKHLEYFIQEQEELETQLVKIQAAIRKLQEQKVKLVEEKYKFV